SLKFKNKYIRIRLFKNICITHKIILSLKLNFFMYNGSNIINRIFIKNKTFIQSGAVIYEIRGGIQCNTNNGNGNSNLY
ncbi:hypothetical protein, partial [Clostridium baratii]|uniref:hypothetical protein n=1 Tax=Clostridium baratii TaxID=1561 RepID=UPI00374EEF6B